MNRLRYSLKNALAVFSTTILAAASLFVPLTSVHAAVSSVTVDSPNLGTEIWKGTQNITWIHKGNGNVNISYCSGACATFTNIATGVAASDLTYPWDTTTIPDGTDYLIKIASANNPAIFDLSNNYFTVDNSKPTIVSATAHPDPAVAGNVVITVVFSNGAGSGMNTAISPTVHVTGLIQDGGDTTVTQDSFVGETWTGHFTLVDNSENEPAVPIAVSGAQDLAGNIMDAVASAGTFAVNTDDPNVNAGTDKVKGVMFTQDATASDEDGIATYQWTKQSGPVGGVITFGTPNAEDTTISADTEGTYVIRLTVVANVTGNTAYDEMTLKWDQTKPTFVSAKAIADTTIEVKFSEPITVTNANGSDFYSSLGQFTVTGAAVDPLDSTKVDLTVNSLGDRAFTSNDLDIAANAVKDSATNGINETLDNFVADGQQPLILDASIPNVPMKVGDVVTVTFHKTYGSGTLTLVDGYINGFKLLGPVNKINNTTSTVTFKVGEGGNDVDAGSDITISAFQVKDASNNLSNIYVLPISQNNDPIDANSPVVTKEKISISGAHGTGGEYIIGDTVKVVWDNSNATGDNNPDIASATAHFAAFGGGDVAMTDTDACGGVKADNVYEACYKIEAGVIEGMNLNASVTAVDLAGNSTTTADNADVTVDNIAPTTSLSNVAFSDDTGTSSTDFITKNGTQTLTATLSATLALGEKLYGSGDNGVTWNDITDGVSVGTTAFSKEIVFVGSDVLKLAIVDSAGNHGTEFSHSFVIDTVDPTFTLNELTNAGPIKTDTINVTANDANLDTTTLEYGYSTNNTCDAGDDYGNAFIQSLDFDVAGDHTDYLCVKATDLAGNIGYQLVGQLNTDNTAPTTKISNIDFSDDTGTSDSDFITKNGTQDITATLSAPLALDEILLASDDNGGSWNNVSAMVLGTAFSSPATVLTGSNTLKFKVQDAAGNDGKVASQDYVIDTSAPTYAVTSVSPASGNVAKIGQYIAVYLHSDSDATGLTYVVGTTIDGMPTTSFFSSGAGDYGFSIGQITEGATDILDADNLPVSLTLKDVAGNEGVEITSVLANDAPGIDAHKPTVLSAKITKGNEITIVYSEPVTTGTSDYSNLRLSAGGVRSIISAAGDKTDTIIIGFGGTPAATDDVALIDISSGVKDLAGNPLVALTDKPVEDGQAPALVSIVYADTAMKKSETSLVTLVFSEAVQGFANDDLTISNGTLTPVATLDNVTWTATFTPTDDSESNGNKLSVDMPSLTDMVGNPGNGIILSDPYRIDTKLPVITSITSDAVVPGLLIIGDTIHFTLTPNKAEVGATINGSYNSVPLTWSTADDGVTYTATYTVAAGQAKQDPAIQITGVVITDAAGNAGVAANGADVAKTIWTTLPATVVASPEQGTYVGEKSVALSSQNSSLIRYTTDGVTNPTCGIGTLYSGSITVSQDTIIKAVGCDEKLNISSVATFIYKYVAPSSNSGGGGGGGYVPPAQPVTPPVTPAPTTPVTPPVTPEQPSTPPATTPSPSTAPAEQAAPVALLIHDPSKYEELLAALGVASNPADFAKYTALVKSDALANKINLTDEQVRAIANFVTYGASKETVKLGSGERRALVRDYMETVGRSDLVWDDIQRLATGQKPVKRNLPKEQSMADRALRNFKLMTGHAPNFKNPSEDLAWNTLMYRIRFTRDLKLEQNGIIKFKTLYKRTPSTPFDWSIVRALGYALK